jgi:hypothetical protein
MSHALVEIDLGDIGRSYVVERLREGHSLARTLAAYVRGGRAVTLLPAATPLEAVHAFAHGGVLEAPPAGRTETFERVRSLDASLAQSLAAYLQRGSQRVVLFENALASPTDPYLRRVADRTACFGKEVYHFVTEDDAERILETLRTAKAIPAFVGVMTQTLDGPLKPGSLQADELEALARNATGAFVGAYDGEGFVMWTTEPSVLE